MRKHGGITLIELAVTLSLIGIIAVIASSTYFNQIRKSRRIDAIETILGISLAEERYRTSNTTYGTLAQVWNGVATTSEGYYTLAISNLSATTYTITATGVGDQANDTTGTTSCGTLTLALSSGAVTKSPAACWPN